MNSCTSSELSACAPPLMTFIIGTGITGSRPLARYFHSDCLLSGRGRARIRERDGEQRIGAEVAFVLGAVELDHDFVERFLLERILAYNAALSTMLTFLTALSTPLPR